MQSDGAVTVSGGATTIVNDSALALQGTVTGNLAATASAGGISDSGTLSISGTSSFTDSADAGIDLGTLQSDGAVTVSGGATSIVNDSALALQGTVTGTLGATASAGGISDSGTLSISGTSSFTDSADAGIDLGTLQSDGAVTVSGGATSIVNDSDLELQGNVASRLVVASQSGSLVTTLTNKQANSPLEVAIQASSGISVTSTGMSEFAAESDSGDISVTNTGGYAISNVSGINGVRFTDSEATGSISLVANSPLTINAPVNAGNGTLQLTAAGSEATDDITITAAISGNTISLDAGDSIAITAGEVISNVLNLNAVQDVLIDVPVTSPQADIVAGGGINLDQHADISSSTVNLTSDSMTIDKAASIPVFSFSIGGEGGLSFDSDGRVQQATQSEWNSYFRASETVQISYKSAGSVTLDQLVLSSIPNEVLAKNTGKIEFEEEE